MRSSSFLTEARRLLAIAVPLWAAQIASVTLPLTDAVYMGRLGSLSLAGGGLASTLLATAILVGGSTLGGLSPRVAAAHAASAAGQVAILVRHARWISLACAALIMLTAIAGEPLLIAAGQEAAVADQASQYLIPAVWSVPLTLACAIHRSVLAACGRARQVSYAWALAVPVNLGLDHVFAYGLGPLPALGLAGLGAATSLVSLGVFAYLTLAAWRAGLEGRAYWIGPVSRPVALDLVRLGGPIALAVAAEAGSFAVAGVAIGWFGPAALAAHRVATIVAHFSFLSPLALSQAAAVRVAAAPRRVRALRARVPLLLAAAWAVFAGLGSAALAPTIAGAFIDRVDPAFELAVLLIYVVGAFQLVDALQSVAAGVLRGTGDTVTAMRSSLIAYLLVAPSVAASLSLAAGLGAIGVWIGLATGLCVASAALVPAALRATRARAGSVTTAVTGP